MTSTGRAAGAPSYWGRSARSPATPRLDLRRRSWRRWRAASSCRMCSDEWVRAAREARLLMGHQRLIRRLDCCLVAAWRSCVVEMVRRVSRSVWSPCWYNSGMLDHLLWASSDEDPMFVPCEIWETSLTRGRRWTGVRSACSSPRRWSRTCWGRCRTVCSCVTTTPPGPRPAPASTQTTRLIHSRGKMKYFCEVREIYFWEIVFLQPVPNYPAQGWQK